MKSYLLGIAIGVDMLGNALIGGLPGMTISERAARAALSGKLWGCILCRWLDRIERNHCNLALISGAARAEAIEANSGVTD